MLHKNEHTTVSPHDGSGYIAYDSPLVKKFCYICLTYGFTPTCALQDGKRKLALLQISCVYYFPSVCNCYDKPPTLRKNNEVSTEVVTTSFVFWGMTLHSPLTIDGHSLHLCVSPAWIHLWWFRVLQLEHNLLQLSHLWHFLYVEILHIWAGDFRESVVKYTINTFNKFKV